MNKRERNELRKLREIIAEKRTLGQIKRLLRLASKDQSERRVHDPIRPQEKRQ